MEDNPAASTTKETPNLITDGHVWRSVWLLSWPTIISMFLQTAYGYINMVFVGRVGTNSVAAVGIGNSVLFLQFSLLSGVGVGTSALVARFVGAQNLDDANEATRQSVLLGALMTLLTGAVGFVLSPYILSFLGARGSVLPIALLYLNIQLLGGIPIFVLYILASAFRSLGDMKTPLYVMLFATALNVLFDWLLVFGIGPFPRMGAPGTAVSVVVSRILALIMAYCFLARSPLKDSLHRWWEVRWEWFSRILRIGVPAALQGLLRSGSGTLFLWIFGHTVFATTNIAALTVGLRAESLAFMPGFAFSMAATALVGQNLGARQPKRAAHAAWIATAQGVVVMSAMALLFFVLAEPFAKLFSKDPEVIRRVVWYLRINAVSEPFLALAMILTGALQGAGETRWPMIITFITMYLFRVPLTYLFMVKLGFDVRAAWWVMCTSVMIGGMLTVIVFQRGRWREIEV